ncbi:MAG TPA: carboxypeptidase regulatory-like domain-containing protein [Candidatus Polarisedimenticolaceae bacterium]|nr:carboxypeptidase regulatory-like domain-containing protein [Candidatus Polarisedimenticolaceae bacterium]
MKHLRSAAATLLVIPSFFFAFSDSLRAAPTVPTVLSGYVQDDGGRALEGAEVLVLAAESGAGAPVVRAVSDGLGRFVCGTLTPGVYRVAAIKSGYVAAFSRVNTHLRASVNLVLHPVPGQGDPRAEKVLDDLSWTLRVPPRSILRELEGVELLASTSQPASIRSMAATLQDSLGGQVEHMVALGSWRPESTGPSSSLEGNETRMRLAGTLGERGSIRVQGRRGSLDSGSRPAAKPAISRAASDLDLDLTYDTGDDEILGMRAFYSSGNLEVADALGTGTGTREGQRSWGYDARWRKQVDPSSRVAVQVGFHDASLDWDDRIDASWDPALRDASNRSIGAEGSYESFAADAHLLRVGVRAQRLTLSAPSARLGRPGGAFALDGAAGWSLLMDSQDRWSISGPVALEYGLAVRYGSDGATTTTLTPRVGGSWSTDRMTARAELSYAAASDAVPGALGYDVQLEAPIVAGLSIHGSAGFIPSDAGVWRDSALAGYPASLYVSDGLASDRFVAMALEHVSAPAAVSLSVARGQASGLLAPALGDDVPVVMLAEQVLDYDAVRLSVRAPRAGSSVSIEYRSLRERPPAPAMLSVEALRTAELEFAQDLVRLAGGRASCRLLLNARGAMSGDAAGLGEDSADTRRFSAMHKRISAGVSLAF